MKMFKITASFFMIMLLTVAVSMEPPSNNNNDEVEKLVFQSVFQLTKDFTFLPPEQKILIIITQTDPLFENVYLYEAGIILRQHYANIMHITDGSQESLINEYGKIQLHLPNPSLPHTFFTYYLIPALKRKNRNIIQALINSGANWRTFKEAIITEIIVKEVTAKGKMVRESNSLLEKELQELQELQELILDYENNHPVFFDAYN